MNKTYRYDEMKGLFPDEWVLVANPETDKDLQVLSGEVLWHTKDRDELYRKAHELGPRDFAILCFSEIPDDMVVVL
jgi:hypothetical protein